MRGKRSKDIFRLPDGAEVADSFQEDGEAKLLFLTDSQVETLILNRNATAFPEIVES